ncbi:HXXEE domain-containing protein [Asaia sp. BMEF1]|uniref:HXXEE domain-containing protein n=1 Tax=Asaia sp. BMEF1 TaxID=3155932 RepID=UPI003F6704C5
MLKLWTKSIWFYVMFALGAGILHTLITHWGVWSPAEKVVAASYILLPFHALEEWYLPGGFAWQYNWVMGKSSEPDQRPMNQLTDMITVFTAMWFGIVQLSVGAGPAIVIMNIVFAGAELFMHTMFGVRMLQRFRGRGKRTLYNPGYATAIIGFLPILCTSLWMISCMKVTFLDSLEALGLIIVFFSFTFMPEKLIKWRNNAFRFKPGYYARFL